jgi:CheY-like chemotaxis protein
MNEEIRILVTDDSEINLEIASALIETRWGIPCDVAISGKEAVELCGKTLYSLILMDYLMPVMNGIEAVNAIKQSKWNFKTPIIALTGANDTETEEELLSSGFDTVLTKPIDENELSDIFKKYIGEDIEERTTDSEHTGAVLAELYAVEGLDVAGGLKNVAGNRDSFIKSLRILKDKLPEANERIASSLLKSDMDRARMYLHSMKSSLANVGFINVSKMAAALESAVIDKNADFYDNNIGTFSDSLEKIGKKLSKVFSAQQKAAFTRPGNEDEFSQSLKTILTHFDNFRFMEAKEFAETLQKIDFGKKKNELLSAIISKLDLFDYDKATSLIKAAL